MENYFDIKALPNPELTQSTVMGYLIENLHVLLVQFEGRIGVAFPAYRQNKTLGGIIRVLANQEDILSLYGQVEQHPIFSDYAFLIPIANIPNEIKSYAEYKRYHFKGTSRLNRLKRRKKLQGAALNDVLAGLILEKFNNHQNLPRICVNSNSTGCKFTLAIMETKQTKNVIGKFNSYGLSLAGATVPLF
jgi:CRISPR-associated endonuclease Csy4